MTAPVNELRETQSGVAELPFDPGLILAVSDFHMSAGINPATGRYNPRENFLADQAFADFLAFHQAGAGPNPLLVLNGDIFDFLRISEVPRSDRDFREWARILQDLGAPKPDDVLHTIHRREYRYGLRTNDYKSVWKLQFMANGHPKFFSALKEWVLAGGYVLFVTGNHDVELYWPLVQEAIRRTIAGGAPPDRFREQVLFCQAGIRIANVYFEHGHMYEPTTRVMGPPVLPNGEELTLPLGSFVNRYLINSLEWLDPFLDNIRPRKAMLQKMLKKQPIQVYRILRHALPMLRRALQPHWWKQSFGFMIYLIALLFPPLVIAVLLGLGIALAMGVPLEDLVGWTHHWAIGVIGLLLPYLLGVIRSIFPAWRPRVGEDEIAAELHTTMGRVSFPANYKVLYGVLGHTHLPDVQKLPRLHGAEVFYINTGTWSPLWRDDRPDLIGRIQHSMVRFRKGPNGYKHEFLDWNPETRQADPTVLWSPRHRNTSGFLNDREFRTVAAFADAFIDGQNEVISPGIIAKRVDEQLARIWSKRVKSVKLALFAVEFLLPLLSFKWRFSKQPVPVRKKLIKRYLGPTTGALGRNLAKIRTLFLAGYYGDSVVQKKLGLVPVKDRARYGGKPPQPLGLPAPNLVPARWGETRIKADLCVIGSGAGGAVIAARAAESGRKVVLLEEGRFISAAQMSHDEGDMSAALYKEGGIQTTSDLGMTILQGRALGGTTVINNGISFRFNDPDLNPAVPDTLEAWMELGAQVDRTRLNLAYDRVIKRLKIDFLPDDTLGGNGNVLLAGWKKLQGMDNGIPDFPAKKFKTNFPGCAACGYCNFGCPYERKLSVLESYITDASRTGNLRILTECHAIKLERDGSRVTVVKAELPSEREIEIEAEQVVVAAGAIGSSVLLLKSGITRNVGKRFSFNLASPLLASFPQELNSYDGIQMATYIDGGDFLLESSFNPPLTFAVSLPGWFRDHFDRMSAFLHFASAGVVIATEPSGRVHRRGWQRNLLGPVKYRMKGPELKKLLSGMSLLAQVYFAAGADQVYPASFVDHPMDAKTFAPGGKPDRAAIEDFLATRLRKPSDLTLNSSHPQGGNPMSDRRSVGVVGSDFRVHGYENLYVCDASIFPTSIRINPQLTIMAMAEYAWDHFLSRAGAGEP